jgi:hypothetical protein
MFIIIKNPLANTSGFLNCAVRAAKLLAKKWKEIAQKVAKVRWLKITE